MKVKILICGLPGSGKTYLAEKLATQLKCAWYNADELRKMANDWDFSRSGRIRQSHRMKTIADFERQNSRTVICDFVCPTVETRNIFDPDFIVWMDTVSTSRFDDTNKVFVPVSDAHVRVTSWLTDLEVEDLANRIKKEIVV